MHTCFRGTSKHSTPKVTIGHYAITLCSAFGQTIEVKSFLPSFIMSSWYDLISLLKGWGLTEYTSIIMVS